MVPTSPGKSWNFTEILGKFWNFSEILGKFWNFLGVKRFKTEISKKTRAFFGLSLYVESSSSLTNCCDFHFRYIECNNVYIFSAHHWVTIFKFAIKSQILQLRNCMSNRSATASVLFDSSPFGTC